MINFNEPVYLEKSMEYVKKAILINKRLNGDGEFTAKCTEWMEQRFGGAKILLTTSCTHGLEMAARSISTGQNMWSGERFSGKKERTGQSSSAGKWISIPGWMSALPTCRVR